jgi:hemerythrin-like metal-binding protein
MDALVWDTSYETGDQLVDDQHRALFAAINGLREAILQGKGRLEAQEALGFLIHYCDTHFQAEEALMAKHHFPGLAAHRRQHQDLLQHCRDLRDRPPQHTFVLQVELFQFLVAWIKEHIIGHDVAFFRYLQARGPQRPADEGAGREG